ncbi:neural Wiskott-Aldrich syndrome protein-like [Penaeus monodon]|uniref:neural Wiskott-Aldrich syndrome protein-like n=1 Tax=Penaeus monodon TaxID=6687 RepID=UPI0018A734C0|nr:neural Wiskott-Aldrich syndrome protein-like [Penaeus monodon]XP_037775150.1 neural Wiskott-Aldrich syndrome protein-like [Penaeus monodon]XP_037775151.1 neural Wiskott-Aldrich syndrome protein-like [Penaeus monodon]
MMAAPKRRPAEHSPSVLLSKEANDKIFSIVGLKCQVLSSGVADVLTAEVEDVPADDKDWQRLHPGVLVALTKDYVRKSYFIQIYNFVEWKKVSEYNFTRGSSYHSPSSLFHHFQNKSLRIGLKFGSEVDAGNFTTAVQAVQAVRDGKRTRAEGRPKPPSVPPPPRPPLSPSAVPSQREEGEILAKKEGSKEEEKSEGEVRGASPSTLPSLGEKVSSAKKKPVAKRISKEMIGKPTNFQHLCHVGFNPEAGFVSDEANHKELQAHFASKGDTPIRPAPPPPPPPPPSTRRLKSPKNKTNLPLEPSPSCDIDDSADADDENLDRNASLNSFSSQVELDASTDSFEVPSAVSNSTLDSSFTNSAFSGDAPASVDTSLLDIDLIEFESPAPSPSVSVFLDADDQARDQAPAPPEAEPTLDSPAKEPEDPTSPSKPEQEIPDSSHLDASPSSREDESRSSHDDLDESTAEDEIIDILTPPTPPPPRRRTNRPQDIGRPPEHPPPPPPHPPSSHY